MINQNSEVSVGYGEQVIGNSVSMLVEKILWISQVPCAGEHVSDKIQTVRKKAAKGGETSINRKEHI